MWFATIERTQWKEVRNNHVYDSNFEKVGLSSQWGKETGWQQKDLGHLDSHLGNNEARSLHILYPQIRWIEDANVKKLNYKITKLNIFIIMH